MDALAVFSIEGAKSYKDMIIHGERIYLPKTKSKYKKGAIMKDGDGYPLLMCSTGNERELEKDVATEFAIALSVTFAGKEYFCNEIPALVNAIEERRAVNERRNKKDR